MSELIIKPKAPGPSQKLYKKLRDQVVSGELAGKLPSIAELVCLYKVNHNTIKKVLEQLKEQRFVYGEQGRGVFVNPDSSVSIMAQKNVTLFLQPNLMLNPFYMRLIFELRIRLEAERCNVNLINSMPQMKAFAKQIDVLLIFEQLSEDELSSVFDMVPCNRVICCNCRRLKGCRGVRTDNFAAGYMAVEHLYQAGCRYIGILGIAGINDESSHFFLRRRGACAFAEKHPDVTLLESDYSIDKLNSGQLDMRTVAELLNRDERPDAVFAFVDLLAIRVYNYCQDYGLRIPEDVSVIGFDNRDFGLQLAPPLSSLQEDIEGIADETVNQIRAILCGVYEQSELLLPPAIIERKSV